MSLKFNPVLFLTRRLSKSGGQHESPSPPVSPSTKRVPLPAASAHINNHNAGVGAVGSAVIAERTRVPETVDSGSTGTPRGPKEHTTSNGANDGSRDEKAVCPAPLAQNDSFEITDVSDFETEESLELSHFPRCVALPPTTLLSPRNAPRHLSLSAEPDNCSIPVATNGENQDDYTFSDPHEVLTMNSSFASSQDGQDTVVFVIEGGELQGDAHMTEGEDNGFGCATPERDGPQASLEGHNVGTESEATVGGEMSDTDELASSTMDEQDKSESILVDGSSTQEAFDADPFNSTMAQKAVDYDLAYPIFSKSESISLSDDGFREQLEIPASEEEGELRVTPENLSLANEEEIKNLMQKLDELEMDGDNEHLNSGTSNEARELEDLADLGETTNEYTAEFSDTKQDYCGYGQNIWLEDEREKQMKDEQEYMVNEPREQEFDVSYDADQDPFNAAEMAVNDQELKKPRPCRPPPPIKTLERPQPVRPPPLGVKSDQKSTTGLCHKKQKDHKLFGVDIGPLPSDPDPTFPFRSHFEKKSIFPNPKKGLQKIIRGETKELRLQRKEQAELDRILKPSSPLAPSTSSQLSTASAAFVPSTTSSCSVSTNSAQVTTPKYTSPEWQEFQALTARIQATVEKTASRLQISQPSVQLSEEQSKPATPDSILVDINPEENIAKQPLVIDGSGPTTGQTNEAPTSLNDLCALGIHVGGLGYPEEDKAQISSYHTRLELLESDNREVVSSEESDPIISAEIPEVVKTFIAGHSDAAIPSVKALQPESFEKEVEVISHATTELRETSPIRSESPGLPESSSITEELPEVILKYLTGHLEPQDPSTTAKEPITQGHSASKPDLDDQCEEPAGQHSYPSQVCLSSEEAIPSKPLSGYLFGRNACTQPGLGPFTSSYATPTPIQPIGTSITPIPRRRAAVKRQETLSGNNPFRTTSEAKQMEGAKETIGNEVALQEGIESNARTTEDSTFCCTISDSTENFEETETHIIQEALNPTDFDPLKTIYPDDSASSVSEDEEHAIKVQIKAVMRECGDGADYKFGDDRGDISMIPALSAPPKPVVKAFQGSLNSDEGEYDKEASVNLAWAVREELPPTWLGSDPNASLTQTKEECINPEKSDNLIDRNDEDTNFFHVNWNEATIANAPISIDRTPVPPPRPDSPESQLDIPFYEVAPATTSWRIWMRYPDKKSKLKQANRYLSDRTWKPVGVLLGEDHDRMTIDIYDFINSESGELSSQPLRSVRVEPYMQLSRDKLQQYDKYGKLHIFKVNHVSYKELVGIRPEKFSLKNIQHLVTHKPKQNIAVDHIPIYTEYLKFGSMDQANLRTLMAAIDNGLMSIPRHRDASLSYSREEVCVYVTDEYLGALTFDGHYRFQKARTRLRCTAFVNGGPHIILGINDKWRYGREVVRRSDIMPIMHDDWISIRKPEFHNCVEMDDYDTDHMIKFYPLDGCRFELLRFRVALRPNSELPMQLHTIYSIGARRVDMRCELLVPGYFSASHRSGAVPCEDVEIRIPVPEDWIYHFRVEKHHKYGSVHSALRKPGRIKGLERITQLAQSLLPPNLLEASIGLAKYEHLYKAIVWRIPRLPEKHEASYRPHLLACKLILAPHDPVPEYEALEPFCHVEYKMPSATLSGCTVRSISVESSGDVEKFVKYSSKYSYTVDIEYKLDAKAEPVLRSLLDAPIVADDNSEDDHDSNVGDLGEISDAEEGPAGSSDEDNLTVPETEDNAFVSLSTKKINKEIEDSSDLKVGDLLGLNSDVGGLGPSSGQEGGMEGSGQMMTQMNKQTPSNIDLLLGLE